MKDNSIRSSFSGEPIEEIKSMVISQAQNLESYNTLKEKLKAELGSREPTKEELLAYIKRQNLASDVIKNVREEIERRATAAAEIPEIHDELQSNRASLTVRIVDGKDFGDYVEASDEKMLQCSISLFGERRMGESIRASLEPKFNYVRSARKIVGIHV